MHQPKLSLHFLDAGFIVHSLTVLVTGVVVLVIVTMTFILCGTLTTTNYCVTFTPERFRSSVTVLMSCTMVPGKEISRSCSSVALGGPQPPLRFARACAPARFPRFLLQAERSRGMICARSTTSSRFCGTLKSTSFSPVRFCSRFCCIVCPACSISSTQWYLLSACSSRCAAGERSGPSR